MTRYRVAVHITPRRGILDPQGKTVADALHSLGFASVRDVHIGRHVVVDVDAPDRAAAEQSTRLRSMARNWTAESVNGRLNWQTPTTVFAARSNGVRSASVASSPTW